MFQSHQTQQGGREGRAAASSNVKLNKVSFSQIASDHKTWLGFFSLPLSFDRSLIYFRVFWPPAVFPLDIHFKTHSSQCGWFATFASVPSAQFPEYFLQTTWAAYSQLFIWKLFISEAEAFKVYVFNVFLNSLSKIWVKEGDRASVLLPELHFSPILIDLLLPLWPLWTLWTALDELRWLAVFHLHWIWQSFTNETVGLEQGMILNTFLCDTRISTSVPGIGENGNIMLMLFLQHGNILCPAGIAIPVLEVRQDCWLTFYVEATII